VLAVRALPTHPSELLASRRMVELMDELHTRFATVIVDAPPILGLPDATSLVDLCDAALIVIAAAQTPRNQIEAALDRIDARKVLGTVFNRFDSSSEPYGAYGRS
jgi:Mrp family chromosome partitioning ATPase